MRRFVILRHETPPGSARGEHWDLMLDAGEMLRTWALNREPCSDTAVHAEPLPDHRRAYLDYEGPVSGNRGSVARFDFGTMEWVEQSDTQVVAELEGNRFRGRVRIWRTADAQSWVAEFLGTFFG